MEQTTTTITTPILLVIFNRPEKVKKIIDILRLVRPTTLFIAADGPRTDKEGEVLLCDRARAEIEKVDWECRIEKHYSEKNIGVDPGVENAITWFFDSVTEGIILEDDCLPHPDFFNFAQSMLKKYAHDERIMHIAGSNFQLGKMRGDGSYYFSHYPTTWGWATWRRAWKLFDTRMSLYEDFVQHDELRHIVNSKAESSYWYKFFANLHNGKYKFWDAKWTFAVWANHGIAITPNIPLIQNIGFDEDATHTAGNNDAILMQTTSALGPIVEPSSDIVSTDADIFLFDNIYRFTLKKKILRTIELAKNLFKNMIK